MKKYSTSLVTGHMQIKTLLPILPIAMFTSLKTPGAGKDELPEAAGWKTHYCKMLEHVA